MPLGDRSCFLLFNSGARTRKIRRMKRASSRPAAGKIRDWRVAIIRKKLERLGRVTAADRDAAEAAAVRDFQLTAEERKRLVIQEVQ